MRHRLASSLLAAGELLAADVLASRTIRMLNGGIIIPRVIWGAPRINLYARIVATDIRASNGVIHVINAVLLPIRVH